MAGREATERKEGSGGYCNQSTDGEKETDHKFIKLKDGQVKSYILV